MFSGRPEGPPASTLQLSRKLVIYWFMADPEYRGHLVLLMAPSGSGKSLLLEYVKKSIPELRFAVSCTTRPMRPGEREGDVYHFVSPEAFDERIARGDFLEWAEYGGHRYGTLEREILEPLRIGQVVLREVELQGVLQIIKRLGRRNVTVIYVEAGDWETLAQRITARAPIDPAELELRHQRFLSESAAKHLADHIVENGEGRLAEAEAELTAILKTILANVSKNA